MLKTLGRIGIFLGLVFGGFIFLCIPIGALIFFFHIKDHLNLVFWVLMTIALIFLIHSARNIFD